MAIRSSVRGLNSERMGGRGVLLEIVLTCDVFVFSFDFVGVMPVASLSQCCYRLLGTFDGYEDVLPLQ